MPRFFFFLCLNNQTIDDWLGRDLPDLDTAILLARQEYPRLNRLVADDNETALAIEIYDEEGNLLGKVAEVADISKAS
jgi:hypothetical protein